MVADEAIVELETDKVNLEVPSPIDGVLSEINSKDGETVEVGALLEEHLLRLFLHLWNLFQTKPHQLEMALLN